MKKYIVGVSAYYHESSVTLLSENKLLDYIKEEEVTRVKGDHKFPFQALKIIINKYKIKNPQIEAIVFYEKPFLGWSTITYNALSSPIKKWKVVLNQFQKFWTGSLSFSTDLLKIIKIPKKKIFYCPHHISHALNGIYFTNNRKKDFLIFVIDGIGDGETMSIFKKINNEIITEKKCFYPHSIGLFYSTFTQFLGFNVNEGESKVMGLASYGTPIFKDFLLDKIISIKKEEIFIDETWFSFTNDPERSYSEKFENKFGKPGKVKDYSNFKSEEFQRLANIAASVQSATEELIKLLVAIYIKKTSIKNIIFSGGVGLNSRAMQIVSEMNEIEELTVPASPGDAGSSLGAAIYGNMVLSNFKFPEFDLYPGKFYNENIQSDIFKRLFEKIEIINGVEDTVADLIEKGNIIATFINQREFGPRALGSRSLICAGNQSKVVEKLNIEIKKREKFRPLAPMIRDENFYKYFSCANNSKHNLLWMGMTVDAKEEMTRKYSKAVHIDHTSRVQIINKSNDLFYSLLLKLEQKDIDMLINTSFNIAGDPMVFDFVDCYTNMKRMDIQYLLADNGLYKINNI